MGNKLRDQILTVDSLHVTVMTLTGSQRELTALLQIQKLDCALQVVGSKSGCWPLLELTGFAGVLTPLHDF